MLLLMWRDLQYRRWRVLLTVVLMAIVMTLLFLMSGLVGQFNAEPYLAASQAAGDRYWVVADGTGGPFTSPKPLDASAFDGIAGDRVLVAPALIDDAQVRLVAHSYDGADEPTLIAGRYPSGPGELVIDESAGLAVGDQAQLSGFPVEVVGVAADSTVLAGVPLAFTTLDFAQQAVLAGRDMNLGVLTDDPPTLPDDSSLKVLSGDDVGADALVPLENAISSVTLVRALLWMITIIVIAAVIYITALERTRDFAVLKAVGGRTRDLSLSLVAQGVVMALAAALLAGLLQWLVAPVFPLTVRVPSSAWWQIIGGGAVAAVLAGMLGVLRVRATSPAEAFG